MNIRMGKVPAPTLCRPTTRACHRQTLSPLTPYDFDLDENHVQKLAKQLGVPQADALCETLAHVALCKMSRGIKRLKEDLVEIWDAIPENLKMRDKSLPESRTLVLGANPRKPDSMTQSTLRACPEPPNSWPDMLDSAAPN